MAAPRGLRPLLHPPPPPPCLYKDAAAPIFAKVPAWTSFLMVSFPPDLCDGSLQGARVAEERNEGRDQGSIQEARPEVPPRQAFSGHQGRQG